MKCNYCDKEHKNNNTGCANSGDCNSGCENSGYYNSGDRNSGWFNTDEPNMRMFNKETNIKRSDFTVKVYPDLKICSWVSKKDLPEEEKTKEVEQMGGMLKTLTYHEAWQEYWTRASEEDKEWFTTLPNFDSNIFKEITSIDINQETEEMTMEEVCKALGKTIKIKK